MQVIPVKKRRSLDQLFGWTSALSQARGEEAKGSVASSQSAPAAPGYYFYYATGGHSLIAQVSEDTDESGCRGVLLARLGTGDPKRVDDLEGQWEGPLSEEEVSRLTNPGAAW